IYREAENLYLGSFSSYARQFLGKLKRPDVERITGLSPAISVNQKSVVRNPRSTVGTLTGLYDYLRLIFARWGVPDDEGSKWKIDRNLFSFNSPAGACENCKGLGVGDRLDPELLVADPSKTLREGALVITTPSGYIIYSQVTMDVLDQVCQSEGFNVDIPWNELTPDQKHIVLYGSDKIEIPFGKHTLESRMRWSGITAKPRDTGFYKGILPIMENILKRDRNKNILRFVRSLTCSKCGGKRLNKKALSISWQGIHIDELAAMPISEFGGFLKSITAKGIADAQQTIIHSMLSRIELFDQLGINYLTLDRESTMLSGGEAQRLRIVSQVTSNLSGILYIFDEPSIGLHASENQKLLKVLKRLRNGGNTVIVVEHEDDFIRQADHVIDIGPEAGIHGGEVLFSESAEKLPNLSIPNSATLKYLRGEVSFITNHERRSGNGKIKISGAKAHNLKGIDVTFLTGAMNVVTGVSGAGKSTLVRDVLSDALGLALKGQSAGPYNYDSIEGREHIKKLVMIDQSPIGRTPRSNPATYTGLSDHIRDLFASLPESKARGWKKGRFSFNVVGGRCETCQGAGYLQMGMHFLGNVETLCETCDGKRFNDETLQVKFKGKSIFEVLEMSVEEAMEFLSGQRQAHHILSMLSELGLGYLKLGQRSTTLSGGEAQRVKLASELARPGSAHTLYVLDEPTTGLHNADIRVLLDSLNRLIDQNNTVILIEHHLGLIFSADHIIDLGPGSGNEGGYLVAEGKPEEIMRVTESKTGKALADYIKPKMPAPESASAGQIEKDKQKGFISFKGVTTHNLKGIDVDFPKNKITVVAGVSGSGKSSLVFDTLYAEGRNRFLESFSPYVRSMIGVKDKAEFDEVSGLTPVLAIGNQRAKTNPRSTVGTMTGIYDLFRLLFSRVGVSKESKLTPLSSLFSFNHQHGACKTCDGMGIVMVCDPDKLVTDSNKSLISGALDGTKTGKFYGDPYGQYIHTLIAAGNRLNIDYAVPWNALSEEARVIAMFGTGDETYDVSWEFKRGKREGSHQFTGNWQGFANIVNVEYNRKHADKRGDAMLPLMKAETCPECNGARLCKLALSYRLIGMNIARLSARSIDEIILFINGFEDAVNDLKTREVSQQLRDKIMEKLGILHELELGYLPINRATSSLSGGEVRRVRLASNLGSGLTDVTFVLDEPTLGLHQADVSRLMKIIQKLKDAGNTVVIVEHDGGVIM
nr:excinuclease ABC subunit UvrA [Bacteroidota bacterium]